MANRLDELSTANKKHNKTIYSSTKKTPVNTFLTPNILSLKRSSEQKKIKIKNGQFSQNC